MILKVNLFTRETHKMNISYGLTGWKIWVSAGMNKKKKIRVRTYKLI